MHFKIQISVNNGEQVVHDVVEFEKSPEDAIGLSLTESKQLLKTLQRFIIQNQAASYVNAHDHCTKCHKKHRIKGTHTLQYRTLFGIVSLSSPRFHRCPCEKFTTKTFSPLTQWLPDHNAPELQYLETKWASLMSYGLTSDLLKDVLPIDSSNAGTVRNHLVKVARRQEKELKGKPEYLDGCPRDWGRLPKPGKPITVGLDGGYVRSWTDKKTNFEVITGKTLQKSKSSRRFGFVEKIDTRPRRRLMSVLEKQGMQANQQITFLSDGADNLRNLQFNMYPESEHALDWFHVTMRLTVLNQFAKGLQQSDPEIGKNVITLLERIKWYLWHGNVAKALDHLEKCDYEWESDIKYANIGKYQKALSEFITYIENNAHVIPNYGEKWRYGEHITTAFVESTVNEVVAKRMVKKQQMQWSHEGAHLMLQTRTAVLNDDLHRYFKDWYPGFSVKDHDMNDEMVYKKAA